MHEVIIAHEPEGREVVYYGDTVYLAHGFVDVTNGKVIVSVHAPGKVQIRTLGKRNRKVREANNS